MRSLYLFSVLIALFLGSEPLRAADWTQVAKSGSLVAAKGSMISKGGGWSGNGGSVREGDVQVDQDNTWFLGDAPVEYCMDVGPGFDPAEMRALVRSAIDEWIAFFRKYGIDQGALGGCKDTISGCFPDKHQLRMSLQFTEVPSCDPARAQLKFEFGRADAAIRSFLRFHRFDIGTAIRGRYDSATYRNRGVVSIQDSATAHVDWHAQPKYLRHLLLHELGHVFGMKHDSVFVMDADAATGIGSDRWVAGFLGIPTRELEQYGQIESASWPFDPKDPASPLRYEIETNPMQNGTQFADFGLESYGPVQIELRSDSVGANSAVLSIQDSHQHAVFIPVKFDAGYGLGHYLSGPGVFSALDIVRLGYTTRGLSGSWQGSFIYGGKTYGIVVEGPKRFSISIFSPDGRWRTIGD